MNPFDETPTGKIRWQPKFGMKRPLNGLPQDWCELQYERVWYDMEGEPHYEWHSVPIGGVGVDD